MSLDLSAELLDQLTWHWENQLRPRLDGLTDDEYLWEPVSGCWNVRPRGTSTAAMAAGSGEMTIDFEFPPPEPAPVTTIAWRIGHIVVGVFGARVAGHFGGPAIDYFTHDYPANASAALAQLDEQYAAWCAGVRSLDEAALAAPSGPAEGPWADRSMTTLVLHIHREAIHHGAEIALLRDLYAHR
ncbi:MAG: DinB family protein [Dermatophilus congolensis]|nr:DinB family protein [Dermatophilus congolensis]